MNELNDILHRPYPLPSTRWIMKQTWENLLFVHWPVKPELLKPHIPSSLQLDTYDGKAWIGMVVFNITGIYFRGFPISVAPSFSEINIRTYVQYDGQPGVYFLSLDVNHWTSYRIAKRWYHLHYHPADISINKQGDSFLFHHKRRNCPHPFIVSSGLYTPQSSVFTAEAGSLEHWLTERYRLYSSPDGRQLYYGDIHHRPWTLQNVDVKIEDNTLLAPYRPERLEEQPVTHFSQGLDAVFWNIRKCRKSY